MLEAIKLAKEVLSVKFKRAKENQDNFHFEDLFEEKDCLMKIDSWNAALDEIQNDPSSDENPKILNELKKKNV